MMSSRGIALIDLITATAVVAILSAMAVPLAHTVRDRDRTRLAVRLLAGRVAILRLEALKRDTHVALRFDDEAPYGMRAYVDGDDDGVLTADVGAGIDPPLGPAMQLSDFAEGVAFRIVADMPAPDDGPALVAGSDPIRLGASNSLSFGPLGTGTSGSIYVASADGFQMCLRLLGTTGRLRTLWFDRRASRWRVL